MLSRADREQLARSFHQELFDTLSARTSSPPELVHDACQHAWLQLERSAAKLDLVDGNIHGWLYTVARHRLYRLSERERRDLSLEAFTETPTGETTGLTLAPTPSPEQLGEQHEDLALLAELPERQQRILLLQAAGFDYVEISEHLGITTRTVERQVLRGRANLRALRDARAAAAALHPGAPDALERPTGPDTREILAASFPSPARAGPRAPQPAAERRTPDPPHRGRGR
jgi:RNA polymerase sigma factor (sigma-70 family)